jgi:hypothetical protein
MDDPILWHGVEPEFAKYGDAFHGQMSFDEFVCTTAATPDEAADIHFASQYLHVTDAAGAVFVDSLGRFEKLAEDFSRIAERLGLPGRLPHMLKTVHEHYSSYYTPECRRLVADRWARDIELFGYLF